MRPCLRNAALLFPLSLILASSAIAQKPGPSTDAATAENEPLEGVRFYPGDGTLYVSPEDVAHRLHLEFRREDPSGNAAPGRVSLSGSSLPACDVRALPDGTLVVPIRDLSRKESPARSVEWDASEQTATIRMADSVVTVRAGWKSVLTGVTFARGRKRLWAPVSELRAALDLPAAPSSRNRSSESRQLLATVPVDLVPVDDLPWSEVRAEPVPSAAAAHLTHEDRQAWVVEGNKRVAVSLKAQALRAWEGERLVLETHVSTGRPGHSTPRGSFRAGPLKTRLLISHKYNDAPMPWSVQVRGDVMIHGFPSVHLRPASHGCIRVPLSGANPARWFYHWVTIGTPITIDRDWPDPSGNCAGSGEVAASSEGPNHEGQPRSDQSGDAPLPIEPPHDNPSTAR